MSLTKRISRFEEKIQNGEFLFFLIFDLYIYKSKVLTSGLHKNKLENRFCGEESVSLDNFDLLTHNFEYQG